MTSTKDLVQLELAKLGRGRDRVAIVRLNRPEQLNPIDWDTVRTLDSRLDEIEANASVRCVLITGNGRAFSAGGDLKSYRRALTSWARGGTPEGASVETP